MRALLVLVIPLGSPMAFESISIRHCELAFVIPEYRVLLSPVAKGRASRCSLILAAEEHRF
jgi:hypothetical protein